MLSVRCSLSPSRLSPYTTPALPPRTMLAMPDPVREQAPPKPAGTNGEFDPDEFRMTIGEHLEELRTRLVYALIGFAVVLVVCLIYGKKVEAAFCAPLKN